MAMALRGELIIPTEADWENAWTAYQRGEAGQAGIVDQVSFIIMRQLGITEAFTNDRHFRAASLRVLFEAMNRLRSPDQSRENS
ncbi:MAG: hypothetical protein RKR03_14740 [Candidatus Competibacter sp.]|nr:hypothetical protein [Candidatus Competibacter sp.]